MPLQSPLVQASETRRLAILNQGRSDPVLSSGSSACRGVRESSRPIFTASNLNKRASAISEQTEIAVTRVATKTPHCKGSQSNTRFHSPREPKTRPAPYIRAQPKPAAKNADSKVNRETTK